MRNLIPLLATLLGTLLSVTSTTIAYAESSAAVADRGNGASERGSSAIVVIWNQALLNIVNNAADAMTTGGTLTVTTRSEGGGSALALDVCDDGTGIAPHMLQQVFDPFVSTKRDGSSSSDATSPQDAGFDQADPEGGRSA